MNRTPQALPHVVIVGGGFAGIYAAKHLGHADLRVTLIDRKNHHTFQPLLYQVATAGLNPGEIAAPIRAIVRGHQNTEVLLAEVTGFDIPNQKVITEEGSIPFDYLIVAAGATHAYFGRDDWAQFAPGLKTVEDAIEMRRRNSQAVYDAYQELGRSANARELLGTLKSTWAFGKAFEDWTKARLGDALVHQVGQRFGHQASDLHIFLG